MNVVILLFVSLVTIGLSIYCDIMFIEEESFSTFARSGSLLVIYGALFESKFILRVGQQNKLYVGGELTVIESKYNEELMPSLFQKVTTHTGFVVMLLGTFIWGFGDLVYLIL